MLVGWDRGGGIEVTACDERAGTTMAAAVDQLFTWASAIARGRTALRRKMGNLHGAESMNGFRYAVTAKISIAYLA